MRVATRLLVAVLTVTGLTACGNSGGDGDDTTLKVAVTTPSWNAGFATLLTSKAEGYFADEGIDVEYVLAPSGTQAAQQAIAGGVDIALVTPEPVVIGATKGTDLTYFASYYRSWIYGLAAVDGSGITDVAGLDGKRIGVTNVSSSGATFARVAMEQAGLNPDDATFVPIGVGAQQITAIKDGQVDALALWDTQYQIVRNAGLSITDIPTEEISGIFGGGFVAGKGQLDENSEPFVKFGRAIAKGVVFAQANPEATIKNMWKTQPETAPGADAPEAEALADQVKVLKVRLAGLGVPEGETQWGVIDPERAELMVQFTEDAGLIDKPVAVDSILNTDLIADINDFAHEDIAKQATDKK